MRGALGHAGWWCTGVVAVLAALAVHLRLPWVPPVYVVALVVLPVAAWRCARWERAPRAARGWGASVAAVGVVALLPVPWMQADLDDPPGSAWRLDGRLVVNGETIDPPGTWYWLTVGRPPIVAEVVADWIGGGADGPATLRGGRRARRPAFVEPAAAAVGLRHAGLPIELGVLVEVSDPTAARLPRHAVLASLNGVEVTTRAAWDDLVGHLEEHNTFTTARGTNFEFAGAALPYRRIDVLDRPNDLDVSVGGPLAATPLGRWYRDLALGSSHGLMIALVSYAHASGDDLARDRTIAGTGRIRGDGSVGTIGGLRAKAGAARDVGADVLLFPAAQAGDLAGFDAGGMILAPVSSLTDAIAALAAPRA